MTRAALSFLATFVIIAIGNAVTHGFIGAPIMADALSVLGPAAGSTGEGAAFLGLAWAAISAATVWFAAPRPTRGAAALDGAIVGALFDGGWNIVNRAVIPAWPLPFSALDIGWHAVHGAAAGVVAHLVWRRFTRP